MTRGTYTAAAGMIACETAQDAIAQNLANVNTTGYKQDIPRFRSFSEFMLERNDPEGTTQIGPLGRGAELDSVSPDFQEGAMQQTGNKLDVALTGDAFLAVQTSQGVRFSRDGALSLGPDGTLITTEGRLPVLDARDQPIKIPTNTKDITIGTDGTISADNRAVGKLALVGISRADNPTKIGGNLFSVANVRPASSGSTVQQGFLETSNVSVVEEMVHMITVMRAYETNSKMLKAQDDATGKAFSDVAKV